MLVENQVNEQSAVSDAAEYLDSLPVAIYSTDAEGYITSYNRAALDLWGQAPDLGRTRWCGSHRLYRTDGQPMAHDESPMAAALKEGMELKGGEAVAERPDGLRVPFLVFPVLRRDATGAVIGAVNTLVDITHHRREREVEPRLAAIIASSHDAIVGKDLNGVITSWNGGAERVFGYRPDEVIGKSITILIPPDRLDEETLILSRMRKGEVVDHFETIRIHKDGSRLPISLTISPIRAANGKIIGVSKIARDISHQKESEQRIKLLMREVNHRVKNQFAVILSMIGETSRRASGLEEFDLKIRDRIMALSRSHDLLVQGDWRGVNMFELLLSHLGPLGEEHRIAMAGPSLTLQPMAVQYLGIAFKELVMNSVRFGVLSGKDEGTVAIEWSVEGEQDTKTFTLKWLEGGEGIAAPMENGFGHVVLTRLTPASVDGTAQLSIADGRLTWQLSAPLAAIEPGSE